VADCRIAPPDRKLMHLDADDADHRHNSRHTQTPRGCCPPNLERLPPGFRTTALVSRAASQRAIALAIKRNSAPGPLGARPNRRHRACADCNDQVVRSARVARPGHAGAKSLRCRSGGHECRRQLRGSFCPEAAVRAVPARLPLLCLLLRSSWLTVEGDRHVGAAGVLHRRGGRAVVAVRVGVAGGVPTQK
jgi:hypothetical protein